MGANVKNVHKSRLSGKATNVSRLTKGIRIGGRFSGQVSEAKTTII